MLVMINEILEGNLGFAGHPISVAPIAGTVGLDPAGEHFLLGCARISTPRRGSAAEGYPADGGGLLSQ
jgi:hypothetical protein